MTYDARLFLLRPWTLELHWAPPPESINISLTAFRKAAQPLEMLKMQIWLNRVGRECIFWLFLGNACFFHGLGGNAMLLKMTCLTDDACRRFRFNTNFGKRLLKCKTWSKLIQAKFLQRSSVYMPANNYRKQSEMSQRSVNTDWRLNALWPKAPCQVKYCVGPFFPWLVHDVTNTGWCNQ